MCYRYRKSLLLATGIIVAGGTAAYVHSRVRSKQSNSFGHCNGHENGSKKSDELVSSGNSEKRTTQKKSGLKSLQVLAAVLLSEMGTKGAKDLFAMVAIAVSISLF